MPALTGGNAGPTPEADGAEREEAARRAALARIKRVATLLLVACILVLLLAKYYERQWPFLGFVAAFAGAAAVGGLADWYAVVALFRRPLGLPVPHTAIIPANQRRIGDNLGRFIETHFLASGPVSAKLREIDFAAHIAAWLADRGRSRELAAFTLRLMPGALASLEQSGLRRFVVNRLIAELDRHDAAPAVADIVHAIVRARHHQRLLDEVLGGFASLLASPGALATLRDKVRRELPALFNLFRADELLVRKVVDSVAAAIAEVLANPQHPVRAEFDRIVTAYGDRLRNSPEDAARLNAIKSMILARPEWQIVGQSLWASLRAYLEPAAGTTRPFVMDRLIDLFVDMGGQLARNAALRAEVNQGFVVALAALIETRKSGVATFIADQVKGWDMSRMIDILELNIGRDLQYIRFNGMLIGGIAGTALYALERLVSLPR
jgi:uncharacterized membrane-anchored protein YjiN (DUF445 family)